MGALLAVGLVLAAGGPSADARPDLLPVPSVSLAAPAQVPIGSPFSFTATFDNTDADETGYGPFVDLIFPVNGADGAAGADTPDGIDFVSATYLGQAVTAVVQTFPVLGCVSHPYARDMTGAFIQVCGTTGDKLVTLLLPFGSFTSTQPPAVVVVNATLSNLADLAVPLTLRARGGFQFGATPLDDWCCDPVIVNPSSPTSGTWPGSSVTPTLITIDKTYSGPEDETATGPNYPRRYTITVTIPSGQTITNLDVTDLLPDNLAFLSVISTSPGGAIILDTPTVGVAATPPDNDLVVRFPSVTGPTSAIVTFEFFVPQFDASSSPVIDPATADDVASANRAGAVGDWTPIDPRDAGGVDNAIAGGVCPACPTLHTLTDKSIALQKGATVVVDGGAAGPSPGDTIEYTLSFQISDFFAFEDLVLSDTISDGQHFDDSFTPTLAVAGNGFSLGAAAMSVANFDVSCNYTGGPGAECTADDPAGNDGQTTMTFRVSDELITRGQSGSWIGGCIPTAGTGGPPVNCASYNDGPTTGTIVFRTVIQDQFTDDFPSGDASVDQGDVLDDDSSVAGDLLTTTFLTPTGSSETDDTGASLSIGRGALIKTVYAVNGSTSFSSPPQVAPGDTVTYRLQYSLPTSDVEDLSFTDYPPLPIFVATEVTPPFDPTVDASPPLAGTAKFGPTDTFFAYSGITPSISSDPVGNSLTFTYGDFDSPLNLSTQIDLLFTFTVSNDPFTDGLFLTNQARAHEGSTNSTDQDADSIIQVQITEPVLLIKKGVIASDGPAAAFVPSPPGPVAFTGPGSAGPRWAGTIVSDDLDSVDIDSDLSDVDAGDLVSFAIVIENVGSGLHGAFDIAIKDTLPAGFLIPISGLNLTVTRGDGTAMGTVPVGSTATHASGLFDDGLMIVDPGGGQGACEAFHATSGLNIVILTYDLLLDPDVGPSQVITNTATLFNYAGEEGGPDHTATDLTDDASVTITDVSLLKDLTATNQGFTTGLNVAVGEFATYTLTVTLPEGVALDVTLTDTLDQGLAFVALDSVTASSGDVTWTGPATATFSEFPVASPLVADQARRMTVDFGNVTNANTDDSVLETITLVYRVVVLNAGPVQSAALLDNTAVWAWTLGSSSDSAPAAIVVEPVLNVAKSALPTTADAGDTVTFTVTVSHLGSSTADSFELVWTDTIPTGMTYVAGTLANTAGLAPTTLDDSAPPLLTASWVSFPQASTSTLTFDVTLDGTVSPGQVLTNTAAIAWTSLPGDVTTPQTGNNSLSTERTGNIANPGGALNDYRDTGSAIVTVFAQPVKSLVSTSESSTGFVTGFERVTIGEVIRYRLVFRLAESTALNFQLQDQLPAGLVFINDDTAMVAFVTNDPVGGITSSTLVPATIGCDGVAGNPNLDLTGDETTVAGLVPECPLPDLAVSSSATVENDTYVSGTDAFFKLGNLTNDDRDPDQELILVEFNAAVSNIAGNAAYNNDTGAALGQVNRANNFRSRIGSPVVIGPHSNDINVRIAEPLIINLVKAVSLTPTDAGDPVQYTLTFTNSSSGIRAATAFDIRVLDTLDANLALGTVVVVAPGYAIVVDASAPPTVDVTINELRAGDSVTITVNATVVNNAPIGATIPNTANLTYTSLPGANGTTPNPTGSSPVGAPGTATGERTGANGVGGLNDYVDSANVSLSLTDPVISKSVTASNVASTSSGEFDLTLVDLVIGEEVTFEIEVTLPEGTSALTITDNLPIIPPDDGILTVVSSQVLSIGGQISGPTLPAIGSAGVATDSGSDADTFLDTVTFDFGDVTNTPDGVVDDNDRIVVEIVARVENTLDNQNAVELTNLATVEVDTGTQTDTVDVEIVEPDLTISKAANDTTPGVGQTVTYALTVAHSLASTADAEDVVVTDVIPAGLTYVPGSASAPAGWTADDSAAPTLVFNGPITQAAGSVALSYQVTVGVPPGVNVGDTFVNTPTLTWTSIPGLDSGERDGSDGPGGLNDYADSASETITVTGIDLTLTKDDGVLSVAPGDVLSYTLTFANVGNTGATGVEISDIVPNFTTFNPGASTPGWGCSPDNNPGSTCLISLGALGAGGGGSVTFAVTVDASVPVTVSQIDNSASITDDGNNGVEPTPADNTDDETTPLDAAPDLNILKDDGLTIVSPGSVLSYTLTYANVGDQDASGVEITDTIPPGTTFVPGSSDPGWSCVPDASAGSLCTLTIGDLAVGAGGSVVFTLVVDDPINPLITQIPNTAVIADDGTNGPDPTPADNQSTDTDALVTVPAADLTKSLIATSQGFTPGVAAAIGEILTYEVVVTIPPGSMAGAALADGLDAGLAWVECLSVTPSVGLTTSLQGGFAAACDDPTNPTVSELPPGSSAPENQGRFVAFNFGDITNVGLTDATLTIQYRVVVLDSTDAGRGDSLGNQATFSWTGGILSESAPVVTVIEPTLTLGKSADPNVGLPGTVITFTLPVNHAPASDSHAFDLLLTDLIPAGLTYVPGSLLVQPGGQTPTTIDDSAAPSLAVRWDDFLDSGVNAVVEYEAILGSLAPGTGVTNTAALEWTSLPDDNVSAPFSLSAYNALATERRYDPATAVDIYQVIASATVRVPLLPETGFAPGRVTVLPEAPEIHPYRQMAGVELRINSIGVDVPIVGIAPNGDGWDLTWLGAGAGWLEGTSFPGWQGNSALTGHVTLPSGEPGPFSRLDELVWGDRVEVQAFGQRSIYEVRQVLSVLPQDRYPLRHEDRAWLTLITCLEFDERLGSYRGRLVVRAILIDVEDIPRGMRSLIRAAGSRSAAY